MNIKSYRLYRSHHGDPLIVVDHPVPVDVCVQDHLVYLAVLHLLPEVGHDVTELLGANCAENGNIFHYLCDGGLRR